MDRTLPSVVCSSLRGQTAHGSLQACGGQWAALMVGLELRLNQCKWAQVKRRDQRRAEPEPEHAELAAIAQVPEAEYMKVLGAPVHMQAGSTQEFDDAVARVWSFVHTKGFMWIIRGHLHGKLRVLHLGMFPCFAWEGGTMHRSASELQKKKARQVRMTHRIAHWFPRAGEDWAIVAERCSAWASDNGLPIGS